MAGEFEYCDEVIDDDLSLLVVTTEDISTVEIVDESIVVISDCVGIPGPPGPPGPEGFIGSAGERIEFGAVAGENLTAYRLTVPSIVDGTVCLADSSEVSHMDRPIWLALQSALTGEEFAVLGEGRVENMSWSWTQGPIYLGEEGIMTQIPPTTPDAVFSAQVGYAITPTSMYYNCVTPILLA